MAKLEENRRMTALKRRLERVLDNFEDSWRSGERLPIESLLADYSRSREQVTLLLRELVAVELELWGEEGQTPSLDDYESRFPGHEDTIREVFREAEQTLAE